MAEPPPILKCCGGSRDPVQRFGVTLRSQHSDTCPSIVRAALSWIEDNPHGDKIKKRAESVFDAILAERDSLAARVTASEAHIERLRDALGELADAADDLIAGLGNLPQSGRDALEDAAVRARAIIAEAK